MNDLIAMKKIAEWPRLKALVLDSVSSRIARYASSSGSNPCRGANSHFLLVLAKFPPQRHSVPRQQLQFAVSPSEVRKHKIEHLSFFRRRLILDHDVRPLSIGF